MSQSVVKIIQELEERFPDGLYVCRGQSKPYLEDNLRVTSTLARVPFKSQGISLEALEEKVLLGAIPFYSPHALDIEIMADLRHFHGRINFIDFTRNPLVALFFACYENPDEDGTLFFLRIDSGKLASARDYDRVTLFSGRQPSDMKIFQHFHTASNAPRAIQQSSVLVYSPSGYLNFAEEMTYSIPSTLKRDIRGYLANHHLHPIVLPRLFPDINGFIDLGLESRPRPLEDFNKRLDELLLYRAKLLQQDGSDFSKAKEHFFRGYYEEAAGLLLAVLEEKDPAKLGIDFHRFLTAALLRTERYQEAIDALARIPEEDWTDEELYVAALSKQGLGDFSGAMVDIEKAIAGNHSRSNYYITMMQIAEQAGRPDALLATKRDLEKFFRSKHGKDSPLGQNDR